MAKQWEINRSEVKTEPAVGNRLYTERFNELYEQLEHVVNAHNGLENAKTLKRKVMEEVVNVVQHNKSWMWLKVRSEYSQEATNIKITIMYSGNDYFDPEENKVTNVIGSGGVFAEYTRKVERKTDENGDTYIWIQLQIKPKPNEEM